MTESNGHKRLFVTLVDIEGKNPSAAHFDRTQPSSETGEMTVEVSGDGARDAYALLSEALPSISAPNDDGSFTLTSDAVVDSLRNGNARARELVRQIFSVARRDIPKTGPGMF